MDELAKDNTSDDEKKWPGIVYAYDFVKPSYDWMLSRMEAAVTRTQAFITIATTITVVSSSVVCIKQADKVVAAQVVSGEDLQMVGCDWNSRRPWFV